MEKTKVTYNLSRTTELVPLLDCATEGELALCQDTGSVYRFTEGGWTCVTSQRDIGNAETH